MTWSNVSFPNQWLGGKWAILVYPCWLSKMWSWRLSKRNEEWSFLLRIPSGAMTNIDGQELGKLGGRSTLRTYFFPLVKSTSTSTRIPKVVRLLITRYDSQKLLSSLSWLRSMFTCLCENPAMLSTIITDRKFQKYNRLFSFNWKSMDNVAVRRGAEHACNSINISLDGRNSVAREIVKSHLDVTSIIFLQQSFLDCQPLLLRIWPRYFKRRRFWSVELSVNWELSLREIFPLVSWYFFWNKMI